MQSNFNKSNVNNKIINQNKIDELLLKNQEIFNQLILENLNRKEKSLISSNEYEYLKNFENNLVQLMEVCPANILNKILSELEPNVTSTKEIYEKKDSD